jgi:hypothetical protein
MGSSYLRDNQIWLFTEDTDGALVLKRFRIEWS